MGPNNAPQRSQPRYQPRRPVVATAVNDARQQQTVPAQEVPIAPVAVPTAAVAPPGPVPNELVLPLAVVSRADISRCLREVESLNEYFHQAGLRGSNARDLPKLGHVLDGLAAANGLNMLHAEHREAVKTFLTRLKAKAPVVHISFPSEAGSDFTGRLLTWFRSEAHPHTVLHIGLQPELAAGCTMRTTNKFYDFSFRARFEKSKQKLIAALEATDKAIQAQAAQTPSVSPAIPPAEGVA